MTCKDMVNNSMIQYFIGRTFRHLDLVRKYSHRLKQAGLMDTDYFMTEVIAHDQSKFLEPEFFPYVLITWQYKCRAEGIKFLQPQEIKDEMNEATKHHIANNKHHPEYHDKDSISDTINREDRDAIPDRMIDGTKMEENHIAEMVADWCAMSEERGNTPESWADKNVNERWKFTDSQVTLIYNSIDRVWNNF